MNWKFSANLNISMNVNVDKKDSEKSPSSAPRLTGYSVLTLEDIWFR